MQDNRRARIIADIVKHLEELDGDELGQKMAPPAAVAIEAEVPMEGDAGPMDDALAAAEGADLEPSEDEVDDDELEELSKLSS